MKPYEAFISQSRIVQCSITLHPENISQTQKVIIRKITRDYSYMRTFTFQSASDQQLIKREHSNILDPNIRKTEYRKKVIKKLKNRIKNYIRKAGSKTSTKQHHLNHFIKLNTYFRPNRSTIIGKKSFNIHQSRLDKLCKKLKTKRI